MSRIKRTLGTLTLGVCVIILCVVVGKVVSAQMNKPKSMAAAALGFKVTPSFIVGGRPVTGSVSFEGLDSLVAAALQEARRQQ